jgi:UDPglucose--hexose-1-phosphate uridylyltransferase
VPNLYPAFERQEVVVHTPRHVRSLAELGDEELLRVAVAWQARAEEARSQEFAYVQLLINEGRAAGASLAHTHSQLVWMRDEPPISGRDLSLPDCRICQLISGEMIADERIVDDRGDLILLCPNASRVPYEMFVGPHETHESDAFADADLLGEALILIAEALRRLRAIEGPVPLNIWLHTAPFGTEGHWHFQIFPRLTVLAGLELGAGIYVNWLPPEEAAAALRNAAP